MGWMTEGFGCHSWKRQEIFIFSKESRLAVGPIQREPPVKRLPRFSAKV